MMLVPIQDISALVQDLKEQQIKVEIERGDVPIVEKITAFVEEIIRGDIKDKKFQEQVITKVS